MTERFFLHLHPCSETVLDMPQVPFWLEEISFTATLYH